MRKFLIISTLVLLSACGGGGGGSSTTTTTTASTINKVMDLSAVNGGNWNTAVGDLNGDGLEDVVIGGWSGTADDAYLWVLIQNTDGTLTDRTLQYLPTNRYPGSHKIFIVDLDNDGKNDIFLPAFFDGPYLRRDYSRIYWGQSGQFVEQRFAESTFAHGACVDDLNNDGLMDLLVGSVGIYYNQGSRSFRLDNTTLVNNNFNACGVIHQANGDINILLGNNDGTEATLKVFNSLMILQSSSYVPHATTQEVNSVTVIDANQDGAKDFAVQFFAATPDIQSRRVYQNTGVNTYTMLPSIDTPTDSGFYVSTINIAGTSAAFFPSGNGFDSRIFKSSPSGLVAYKPEAFANAAQTYASSFGGTITSVQAVTVYQNSSKNKSYVLQCFNGQKCYTNEL